MPEVSRFSKYFQTSSRKFEKFANIGWECRKHLYGKIAYRTGSRNTGIQLGTLLVHKVGAGGARAQRRRSTTLEERQKRAQGVRFPEFLEKENDSLTPDEKTALSLLSKLDEWLHGKGSCGPSQKL